MPKRIIAFIILFSFVFLCACQPTPDEEYIVNKGDNKAGELIEATPSVNASGEPEAIVQPEFPEHWTDDILTEYNEMVVDADLIREDMEKYPVHLVARHTFTVEEAKHAAACLFPQIKGYCVSDRMHAWREFVEKDLAEVVSGDLPEETKKEHIPMLQDLLDNAVDMPEFVPVNSIEEIEAEFNTGYTVQLPDDTYGLFEIFYGYGINRLSVSTSRTGGLQSKSMVESEDGGYDGEVDGYVEAELPLEDAIKHAEEFLEELGIEGFVFNTADEVRSIKVSTLKVLGMGWNLQFLRTFGYTPIDTMMHEVSTQGFGLHDDEAYSENWKMERIEIYVDGQGVQHFVWDDPIEDLGVVNENVQLLDFDSMKNIITHTFYAALGNPDPVVGWYRIDRMVLTVTPQTKKDSNEGYMMPTWICEIGYYHSNKNFLSFFRIPGGELRDDYFTVAFNAIDGTRMNLAGL